MLSVHTQISPPWWWDNQNRKAQMLLTNPSDAKSCQKLLQFNVLTTLSLTILAYLHSFSCCCVWNEFKIIQGQRSWCNRKCICNFLLVISSNFGCISYIFEDIDTFSYKIVCFPHPPLLMPSSRGTPCTINIIYTLLKVTFNGL